MSNEDWPTKEQVLADSEFQKLQRELGLKLVETSEDEAPLMVQLPQGRIREEQRQRIMDCLKRLFPTDVFHILPPYPLDSNSRFYETRMSQLASHEAMLGKREETSTEETKVSLGKTILAADTWVFYSPDHPNERVKRFSSRGRPPIKQLISNTLLYDEIVIPTQDFLGYGILVDALGERGVLDLLEAGRLKFLRVKSSICYAPGGRGLMAYGSLRKDKKPKPDMAPLNEAISWALGGSNAPTRDPLLFSLAEQNTREINMPIQEIRHETYMDVLNSPSLREAFCLRNSDLDNLAGINLKQIRVYSGPDVNCSGDEIDTLLSIAEANLELRLRELAGCSDSSTLSPVGHLLKAKAERSLGGLDAAEAFAVLREIADVPDVGEGVLNKQATVGELLKVSRSRSGEQFRKWFHENCRDSPIATGKEYAALLRDVPRIQSMPVKVLRFIITSGLGAIPGIGLILGLATGAVDSFFIEKWLRGNFPKYFIDNLRQIKTEERRPGA
jgi:hypothetical protein